jgi:hypothetical protein
MTRTVAYDVDRKPGAWVSEQAANKVRSFAALYALLVVAFLASAVIWLVGHHVLAAVAYVAFLCFAYAAHSMADLALPWRKGAHAEVAVGRELEELRAEGYRVMHDFMFGGEGNVDHLVCGPNGVFMVETKFRRYEEKQLGKAKNLARKLHDELGCWVTPVICAGVRKKTYVHKGVLIAGRGDLADAIRSQPAKKTVDPDRLARFADRLS